MPNVEDGVSSTFHTQTAMSEETLAALTNIDIGKFWDLKGQVFEKLKTTRIFEVRRLYLPTYSPGTDNDMLYRSFPTISYVLAKQTMLVRNTLHSFVSTT